MNIMITKDENLEVFAFSERSSVEVEILVHKARFSDVTNIEFALLSSMVWIQVLYLF